MINSACSWGLWLGWIKNSDWPLGQWNGHPVFIEITLKKQPSKSTINFAGSTFTFRLLFQIGNFVQMKFLMKILFFFVIEEYFRRVASLTSLTSVRLIVTERFGFTCFDHWFSHYHVIVSGWFRKCDGSGCFLTLWQEKKYGYSYHDLSGF